MKLKTVAMTGVMSLAGLGLIGAGAHAAFTTTASSSQTITAGAPAVALWASNAAAPCTSFAGAEGNPVTCNSITLTAPAAVGSTFDAASDIGAVNVGTIAVNLTSFAVSDSDSLAATGANGNLEYQLGLCINTVYNGLLTDYPSYDSSPNPGAPVTPVALGSLGAYTTYGVDLYAGGSPTYCNGTGVVPALLNDAAGGFDTVTITAGFTG
jgi:hypothetical protein